MAMNEVYRTNSIRLHEDGFPSSSFVLSKIPLHVEGCLRNEARGGRAKGKRRKAFGIENSLWA